MTADDIQRAMLWREPVVLARGSAVIEKPLKIRSLAKVRREEFDVVTRGLSDFYYEVGLIDPNGRGWITASPEQLEPYDAEKFAAMTAQVREYERRRREYAERGRDHDGI